MTGGRQQSRCEILEAFCGALSSLLLDQDRSLDSICTMGTKRRRTYVARNGMGKESRAAVLVAENTQSDYASCRAGERNDGDRAGSWLGDVTLLELLEHTREARRELYFLASVCDCHPSSVDRQHSVTVTQKLKEFPTGVSLVDYLYHV